MNKQEFLENLYALAKSSIAIPVDLDSDAVETFKLQVQRYLALTKQREQLEKRTEEKFLVKGAKRVRTTGVSPLC